MRPSTIALLFASVALAGCIHSDYLGKSYPATEKVDMYFDEADIHEDYEVMGEVTLETDSGMDFAVSSGDMQEKVMEMAREKGADAFILGSLEKRNKGEQTSTTGNTSTTDVKESKMVKARLIKYRKNLPVQPDGGN